MKESDINNCLRFHQFVHVEKGVKKSLISDFSNGNVFQVANEDIERFKNGQYALIKEFLKDLKKEGLIINCERNRWIPNVFDLEMDAQEYRDKFASIILEVEEAKELPIIIRKFISTKIKLIIDYGKKSHDIGLSHVPLIRKVRSTNECENRISNVGKVQKMDVTRYVFNHKYNECWGKRITVDAYGNVKPCIYSAIKYANIENDDEKTILDRATNYWLLTKDKVEKCKNCELRFYCPDCREYSYKLFNELFQANPQCQYNPDMGLPS